MRKAILVFLTVILVGAAYYIYPFWTGKRIAHALATGDASVLEAHVDFPRVRDGLKADLSAQVLASVAQDTSRPGAALLTVLSATLGPKMLEAFVESFVTPAGLANLAGSGRVEPRARTSAVSEDKILQNVRATRFVSPDTFVISLGKDGDDADTWFHATMSFSGLTWRITSVRLPDRAFAALRQSELFNPPKPSSAVLLIEGIKISRRYDAGIYVLAVEGTIRNSSDQLRTVPRLRALLQDANDQELQSSTFSVSTPRLRPNEVVPFKVEVQPRAEIASRMSRLSVIFTGPE